MTKNSRIRSWIMLCLAIALEIAGLSLLQVFEESPVLSKVISVFYERFLFSYVPSAATNFSGCGVCGVGNHRRHRRFVCELYLF